MPSPNGNGNGYHTPDQIKNRLLEAGRQLEEEQLGAPKGGRRRKRPTFKEDVGAGTAKDGKTLPTRRGDCITRRVSAIVQRPVDWTWERRVMSGALNLFSGDKGAGKSSLAAMVATIISTGGCWPDQPGRPVPRGRVLILSAEEDPECVIRPRLERFGADLDRVEVVDGVRLYGEDGEVSFSLAQDLEALEAIIDERGDVRLVIIDTITSYLGDINQDKASEVRRVLEPFRKVAARYGFGGWINNHFNKGAGTKAYYRSSNSNAIPAICRMTWTVSNDPEDKTRKIFAPSRSNMSIASALAFRVFQEGNFESFEPRFEWEPGAIEGLDADELLAREAVMMARAGKRAISAPKLEQVAAWLEARVCDDWVPLAEIEAEGKGRGYSRGTMCRCLKGPGFERAGPKGSRRVRKLPRLPLDAPIPEGGVS
jgi:putative DNA primase/helicase